MKIFKRIISAVLLLCIIVTLLPSFSFAKAAETVEYVLDTDGLDDGAEYLIVKDATVNGQYGYFALNGAALTAVCSPLTTLNGTTIGAFDGIENYLWLFESNGDDTYSLSHNGKYLDFSPLYLSANKISMRIQAKGNPGQYVVFEGSGIWGYYLSFYPSSGQFSNSYNSMSQATGVYFYKKVSTGPATYTVTFDGNGHTSGDLPAAIPNITAGDTITLPAPTNLIKQDGENTWLFRGWVTEANGSGNEYKAGESFTVTGNTTLYANWYLQTKKTLSLVTYLDGVATDVGHLHENNKIFYAQLDGSDEYILLSPVKDAQGNYTGYYSAQVTENGTYWIYTSTNGVTYEKHHDHKVIILNQDGQADCRHYSVTYDTVGGTFPDGTDSFHEVHHVNDTVQVTNNVPTLAGNHFLGWTDGEKVYQPGAYIPEAINKPIQLTALWEKTVTVTVNVTIEHDSLDGGTDNNQYMHDAIISLLREENGVNLPVTDRVLTTGYTYDKVNNITTYTIVFTDLPQGTYHVTSVKSGYESTMEHGEVIDGNQVFNISMRYAPTNFDLHFNVVVNADDENKKALMPQAVNVKVSYWGYNALGQFGWHIITQQDGSHAPTTVFIDKDTGLGSSFFPVWCYWSGSEQAYEYRVEVTSFVMPDGTIVPAAGNRLSYTAEGSGLYAAAVTIENGGRISSVGVTSIPGSYFDGTAQNGIPTVTIDITPLSVTLNAGEGTINGQHILKLDNMFRYPDLAQYNAIPADGSGVFLGWKDANGHLVADLSNALLAGNVTLYANYGDNFILSGDVTVESSYDVNGQTAYINKIDLPQSVLVILQRQADGIFYNIDSQVVPITYEGKNDGTGHYIFADIPNDGSQYRVQVSALNFTESYDNDQDSTFRKEEALILVEHQQVNTQVDVLLDLTPTVYEQTIRVDTSLIHADLRPTSATVELLYRNPSDIHSYKVISQHATGGMALDLPTSIVTTSEVVWNWHTDGPAYEYQLRIPTVFGNNVPGAYDQDGTDYTEDLPYTIVYGAPSSCLTEGVALEATFVPKEIPIILDLNLAGDDKAEIRGIEHLLVDRMDVDYQYAFIHTWSYAESFAAYPYRPGYIFLGWESSNEEEVYIKNDLIYVGNTLDKPVVLKAKWAPLQGTDYTVRFLELTTEKVLHPATSVSGSAVGDQISVAGATEIAGTIDGYKPVGASINGEYFDLAHAPNMTITSNPATNRLTIYYLPDNGLTHQVESNLGLDKNAILENNGTYTITLDTFTKDNPITTLIEQDTPLDIVLVLDQSGSMWSTFSNDNPVDRLIDAVENFIGLVHQHGQNHEVDHRIAIVGFGSDGESYGHSGTGRPVAGKDTDGTWVNTGLFDSNGDFQVYPIKGFTFTEYTGEINKDGTYYTKVGDDYLLLTYHTEYRHLITEEEARLEYLKGTTVYGSVDGNFVKLTRNSSGLWLYGNEKLLYSHQEFFTYHTDVWTHRKEVDRREIHGYGTGANFRSSDGHEGIYTRTATKSDNYEQSVYYDALMPVSVGSYGSGAINPGLLTSTTKIGASGKTYASYGLEMANSIFEAHSDHDDYEERTRFVILFSDGKPGDSTHFDEAESNASMAQAYKLMHSYNADIYSVGLYLSSETELNKADQKYFMQGISSNYPDATEFDDIWEFYYGDVPFNRTMNLGSYYYSIIDGEYVQWVPISPDNLKHWGYYDKNGVFQTLYDSTSVPYITDSYVGDIKVYRKFGESFKEATNTGYYTETTNADELTQYFANIVQSITTKISTEVVLEDDTILRDIMNQGLVLTDKTIISTYLQEGNYDPTTGGIIWVTDDQGNPALDHIISLELSSGQTSITDAGTGVTINVYNLDAENATDDMLPDYSPHTVDVTGYNFSEWYINPTHSKGYKLVVQITSIEATDDVDWGRSTYTNNKQSGLWLPADKTGTRELLMAFEQPSTILIERAYVLDYGKECTLNGWYFDDVNGQDSSAVHVDCIIDNGMNQFDPSNPNSVNAIGGKYGSTKYGNVRIENGEVIYSPTTTNWNGYDQFYVFGNTADGLIRTQEANANGNLWQKVTVIPANNIYYEDSFITTEDSTQNGIEGFTFTGAWSIVGENAGNTEVPEKSESAPYGDVHGWTDSLGDDITFTDGSAHVTGLNGEMGAKAELTFTGTGIEVYTRTNATSGMVVAVLSYKETDGNGKEVTKVYKSLAMDNLAMSGDYYHIPTIAFKELPYRTYSLQLIATMSTASTDYKRYEYYIDGIRIHNPLGNDVDSFQSDIIKDAYGLETYAVFTEVRDILLDYGDFNAGIPDSSDGKMGAVFIDWIQDDQGGNGDQTGLKIPTYQLGTFEAYGPKNEVYLSPGQAIVLKVDEANTYFVGLKSLNGVAVTANVSGIDRNDPAAIQLTHTTDMYYQVTPIDGYIVILNGSQMPDDPEAPIPLLSITNLRTTSLSGPAENGGVLSLAQAEAVEFVTSYTAFVLARQEALENAPPAEEPEAEEIPSIEEQVQANIALANRLFTSVRQWLMTDEEEVGTV